MSGRYIQDIINKSSVVGYSFSPSTLYTRADYSIEYSVECKTKEEYKEFQKEVCTFPIEDFEVTINGLTFISKHAFIESYELDTSEKQQSKINYTVTISWISPDVLWKLHDMNLDAIFKEVNDNADI